MCNEEPSAPHKSCDFFVTEKVTYVFALGWLKALVAEV